MARHLVRSLWPAAIAAALILCACSKLLPADLDHSSPSPEGRTLVAEPRVAPPDAPQRQTASGDMAVASAASEPYQPDDPPPWLAELLHSADPNVRIQGLDAWAHQPGRSLDPVTYALVDPDESVRVRAQQVLEQELARR